MEKTGEVKAGKTACDKCGRPACIIIGSEARCEEHCSCGKEASGVLSLKAFTKPLEELDVRTK
jgi:hypothetical protein